LEDNRHGGGRPPVAIAVPLRALADVVERLDFNL
jgi:hypothetical protein